jgi:hypothetical protein
MREVIKMDPDPSFRNNNDGMPNIESYLNSSIGPFFSIRKLRLIYNELHSTNDFEYQSFDAFKHHVLSAAAPQLELNKWQAISSRR